MKKVYETLTIGTEVGIITGDEVGVISRDIAPF